MDLLTEVEDVYDQLTKWINGEKSNVEASFFTSTLLKRALSDSSINPGDLIKEKKAIVSLARSFSLEQAKNNPELAKQLVRCE